MGEYDNSVIKATERVAKIGKKICHFQYFTLLAHTVECLNGYKLDLIQRPFLESNGIPFILLSTHFGFRLHDRTSKLCPNQCGPMRGFVNAQKCFIDARMTSLFSDSHLNNKSHIRMMYGCFG